MGDYQSPTIANLSHTDTEPKSSTVVFLISAVAFYAAVYLWAPNVSTCETLDCPYGLA